MHIALLTRLVGHQICCSAHFEPGKRSLELDARAREWGFQVECPSLLDVPLMSSSYCRTTGFTYPSHLIRNNYVFCWSEATAWDSGMKHTRVYEKSSNDDKKIRSQQLRCPKSLLSFSLYFLPLPLCLHNSHSYRLLRYCLLTARSLPITLSGGNNRF